MEPDLQSPLQSSGLITFSFNKIFTIDFFYKMGIYAMVNASFTGKLINNNL